MFKNYMFLNISFIIIYLLFFLVKVDTYMIILYIYLLLLDIYYFYKIEKIKNEFYELLEEYEKLIEKVKGENNNE